MAARKKTETIEAAGEVTIRYQHDSGSEVREFSYPLEPIPPGSKEEREAEAKRRCDFFNFTHTRSLAQIGTVKNAREVLMLAVSQVDTRVGGWCEVLKGGVVVAAHPRQLARQHGAEWVGNLGAGQ